jgi:S-layer protein (TIGR01564 family)
VLSGASTYSITGIGNITATPSVSTAAVPVLLDNMSTPLVVLDSAANPQSSLILVGSGYVNALSAQLQSAYSINMTPTSAPVMQAYGTNRVLIAGYYANQTTAEANAFIAQLYAKAAGK